MPITSCKFNFDSVLTDVTTMAAVARVVELVGVGAYIGGATLLTDPVLLTSAASILTIEARHQTLLNVLSPTGSSVPAAFDIALKPQEVLAIAAPFFDGPCDLGIPRAYYTLFPLFSTANPKSQPTPLSLLPTLVTLAPEPSFPSRRSQSTAPLTHP